MWKASSGLTFAKKVAQLSACLRTAKLAELDKRVARQSPVYAVKSAMIFRISSTSTSFLFDFE